MRHFILLAALCAPSSLSAGHELEGRDIEVGQTLYAEQCASCHGANLEGQANWRTQKEDGTLPAPPHDPSGHTWHHDNKLLFNYTYLGGERALALRGLTGFKSGMPSFEGVITEDQIWDILAFIHSTWPDEIKEVQAMRNPPH